ncbi:oligopeptide/dipeptide ABC transporter ATP-binding protein [Azospirillum lipoferum]|uniref:ABC transporter ATP-binding protein n=1 Tax=Azospirillum lipoferum TaxID=193 RepID=A0A5A9G6R7_AZOLI|nr:MULTISPECIES: ABC transporter ATP-binding protein [Azospirillum]KAA0590290.1 ABC transporter ATP-binding protein [Azospirillum lipoferum]MCP1614954.1 oligopeptide/dipeptide ABC transporter ATP-binding protein [Azospirillum lipoferum]MDW5532500.1 ABC transporter ATP-binding protein [Azospirillum sp. NL1]
MDADLTLDIRNLQTHFTADPGVSKAVDGVSFAVRRNETLAVVGESGSGKSVTSLSAMRLIPTPPGIIAGGEILFRGRDGQVRDLARLSERAMRSVRGNEIGMIFQEPMTSLNPVYTVGDQIGEALRYHQGLDRRAARAEALAMLKKVGIPAAERRLDEYPHQMSGGMRQRVMIAMALACRPTLLIADEPTTALDVTIQAQILDLMRRLQEETGTSILFITHNLGVVAEVAHRVVVMYAGRIVEEGDVRSLLKSPKHPYTRGLLACMPHLGQRRGDGGRLYAIPGSVPSPVNRPAGCTFAPRCALAEPACLAAEPVLEPVGPDHSARCRRWRDVQ